MAVTIGNFTAINDSEVDAESPITESLVTRLRDNAYWVNAGTTKTTETTATKYLKPDGSGGVSWGDTSDIGVDGIHGVLAVGTSFQTVLSRTDKKVVIFTIYYDSGVDTNYDGAGVQFVIKTEDNTVSAAGISAASSDSTATGDLDSASVSCGKATIDLNSGNYRVKVGAGTGSLVYVQL